VSQFRIFQIPAVKNLYREKPNYSDSLIALGAVERAALPPRHSPVETLIYCRIPMKKLALNLCVLNLKESKVFVIIGTKYSRFVSGTGERVFWVRYLWFHQSLPMMN
jgi:hypothetical protein